MNAINTKKLCVKLVAAKDDINAPAAKLKSIPTLPAKSVNTGAVTVPANNIAAVVAKPITIFLNKLPLVKATTNATLNGTTAKSAKGKL